MGVSEGSMVAVGEFVGVTEGGKEGVSVSAGVRVGVIGVGVMKKGVKEGINVNAASAVCVAGCTHNGVLVGCSGRGPPAILTSARPVQ
ncbi:MAG: hypothetical protein H6Q37_478 [Chloroflexi bacterium]|nr:hypothetical protein [Chloroflexota bacterium]